MMVLAGEVYYYKKKTKKEEEMKKASKYGQKIHPLDNFEYSNEVLRKSKNTVLLGSGTFEPVTKGNRQARLSIISINPRD